MVNFHGDWKSPKDRVVGPLPNGRTLWLIHGGLLTAYKSWDDPPSKQHLDLAHPTPLPAHLVCPTSHPEWPFKVSSLDRRNKQMDTTSMDYSNGSGDRWAWDYITPQTKARTIPGIQAVYTANRVIIYY